MRFPDIRKHNLFKYALLINVMVDEPETPEKDKKPEEDGEKAVDEKAKDLEEKQ